MNPTNTPFPGRDNLLDPWVIELPKINQQVNASHHSVPVSATSHPDNPIPEEPTFSSENGSIAEYLSASSASAAESGTSISSLDADASPKQKHELESALDISTDLLLDNQTTIPTRRRRASTILISQSDEDIRRLIGTTKPLVKVCCGGGCCFLDTKEPDPSQCINPVKVPDSDAYRSLRLNLGPLSLQSKLTKIEPVPLSIISFKPIPGVSSSRQSTVDRHPPHFVTPHPPFEVYSARLHNARELTKPGAEKRTYHFDLDVTDYPVEGGDVDFKVGGAIGVCAPNSQENVEEFFDLLGIPRSLRDRPVILSTKGGRWPTIWGEEEPRELETTRMELLTWCTDIQSYPPTKSLLRLLAEYAAAENEKMILLYLASAQGQGAFCDLRTNSHITLNQLLHAFPSSQPPLDQLLSTLQPLMPRFYSLSNDPHVSSQDDASHHRRLIEIAVTVHETIDWRGNLKAGLGSGFFERSAQKLNEGSKAGISKDIRIPMFRGLMTNPLAREFVSDGPMLLIGAGVGVAPFRGFVQRRLKSANCANKVWVLQGIRDSLLDELYSGEWGVHEDEVKRVVQSRSGEGHYVQEEVKNQSDLVWFIINSLDGRVFVCGSSKGMGEGVEEALVDVAMEKGNLRKEDALEFWKQKKDAGQYIAVSISLPALHTVILT
ncbi:MAG: hypothetical protein M1829_001537 [Trizodia sp. TS-e1964]|nr:MAG: hypothetical protein M1829_001537 [Trizodia sp. TS-e1964]